MCSFISVKEDCGIVLDRCPIRSGADYKGFSVWPMFILGMSTVSCAVIEAVTHCVLAYLSGILREGESLHGFHGMLMPMSRRLKSTPWML